MIRGIHRWWIRNITLRFWKGELYSHFKKKYVAFVGFKPVDADDDDSVLAGRVIEEYGYERLTWIAWISPEEEPVESMGGPKG